MDSRAGDAPRLPPAAVGGSPAANDERELIAALLRHDRKAAATFVAAHIDALYAFARHRLAPRADLVDDVVQDTFLAAFNGLRAFQAQSSLRTWVIGIARHKIEDVYRQRLRTSRVFDEIDDEKEHTDAVVPALDEQLDAARVRDRTRLVLARLPERYGLLLLWRYWEQRSTREISAATGATEKGVERALARARASFKALWMKDE